MDNIPNQSPVVQQPPTKSTSKVYWWIVATVFFLVLAACLGIWSHQISEQPMTAANRVTTSANDTVTAANDSPAATVKTTPVIIFTREVSSQSSGNRSWPTVQIERKVGDADPEILATVGKVDEYPSSYILSPDRKYLLVNLESKLQALNLETKVLSDLFTARRQVMSANYSPDGKQLLIWDQRYVSTDGSHQYFLHVFTIDSRADQILAEGEDKSAYIGSAWRSDNQAIIQELGGEGSIYYLYNLASKAKVALNHNIDQAPVSQSGQLISFTTGTTDDVCNEFSGSAVSSRSIVNPLTKETVDTLSHNNDRVRLIAFSPDDHQVLFAASKTWTDRADCDKTPVETYLLRDILTKTTQPVADPTVIYRQWNNGYIGATYQYDSGTKKWTISLNGQAAVTSDGSLTLVDQFYQ